MSRSIRRILSVFVLITLTVGSVQALPVRPTPSAVAEAAGVLDAAWTWLVGRLRPAKPALRQDTTQQQRKYGCGMDPDGKPKPCEN